MDADARLAALEQQAEFYKATFEQIRTEDQRFRDEVRQEFSAIKGEQIALNKIASSIELLVYKIGEVKDNQEKLEGILIERQEKLENSVADQSDTFTSKLENLEGKISSAREESHGEIAEIESRISKVEQNDTKEKAALVDKFKGKAFILFIGAVIAFLLSQIFPFLKF